MPGGMRLEPNLSILYTEVPLAGRPAAAAAAGFIAGELWWPFDEPVPDPGTVDDLVAAFASAGLGLACLNFYAGDLAAGDRGILAKPRALEVFRANVDVATDLARRLGCRTLNALYGRSAPGSGEDLDDDVAIANLAYAVSAADTIGARVVVEAINPVEMPGYGLPHVVDAVAFLDRAREHGGIEAWLSFDVYHVAMAGDQPDELVDRFAPRFAHVQFADVPGRHEPGTGGLDFGRLGARLEAAGYEGWVGLEYVPTMESSLSVRQAVAALAMPGLPGDRRRDR